MTIRISEAVKLQIDLAAESAIAYRLLRSIAAERDSKKIAVEIKSFVGDSDISAFHTALGQYLRDSLLAVLTDFKQMKISLFCGYDL